MTGTQEGNAHPVFSNTAVSPVSMLGWETAFFPPFLRQAAGFRILLESGNKAKTIRHRLISQSQTLNHESVRNGGICCRDIFIGLSLPSPPLSLFGASMVGMMMQ